jgi:hypothetical protein
MSACSGFACRASGGDERGAPKGLITTMIVDVSSIVNPLNKIVRCLLSRG